ncbi:Retrovirus-related Pol polyprotein from type-2 retrotransposable element R2DM, partial [Aduncisulcus paluster]
EEEKFIFPKFTLQDIKNSQKAISGTAAGPDGITPRTLAKIPPELWRLLFNSMIQYKLTPRSFQHAKLTLIDKDAEKESPRDITCKQRWRPICVSDTVQRLVFRPIVEKFVQFAMAKHLIGGYQRGFLPGIDGCVLNIIETREWLAENRSRCAAAIDIADAYGSVPHEPLR